MWEEITPRPIGSKNRTVANMEFIYNGKPYKYDHDFGPTYPMDAAEFIFEEGNYSCDCNRSVLIRSKYGNVIPELDCGNIIEMKDLHVIQTKNM